MERIAIIWQQVESDAQRYLAAEQYKKKLIDFKNALKEEFHIDKFGIIKTGYFASYADWINGSLKKIFGQTKYVGARRNDTG